MFANWHFGQKCGKEAEAPAEKLRAAFNRRGKRPHHKQRPPGWATNERQKYE
jgi:hypothetical protein